MESKIVDFSQVIRGMSWEMEKFVCCSKNNIKRVVGKK